ncbi:MAG: efflux RND transporter periplasmic adaptor subunit [Pseudomonadota bacterium]
MAFVWRAIKEVFWLAVAVAIIAGGFVGFQYLGANRTVVEAAPVERTIPSVETTRLARVERGVPIDASGFIAASRLLDIAAQTGGRITELHPAIDERGTFSEGDVLFRLDDRNAKASIAQITASIESTVAQLDLVTTQLERAQTLRDRGIIPQDQLDQSTTREQELQANLRNLEAGLEAAEIALANTVVTAPFDGRVLAKQAELGAVIAQGAPVAQIYSDSELEVTVNIREAEAALIADLFGDPKATAFIEKSFAGGVYRWDASIIRVERQIDPTTRTLAVTLGLEEPSDGKPIEGPGSAVIPALINAYVTVGIEAQPEVAVFALDGNAVRNDREVWIVKDDALHRQPVRLLHRAGGVAYLTAEGLDPDADIIASALSAPTDGMDVSVISSADNPDLTSSASGG